MGREPARVVSPVQRDPGFGTDVLSSGILDFGSTCSTFTVGTQSHPSQWVDVIGTAGEITIHLPFNAWTYVPLR